MSDDIYPPRSLIFIIIHVLILAKKFAMIDRKYMFRVPEEIRHTVSVIGFGQATR